MAQRIDAQVVLKAIGRLMKINIICSDFGWIYEQFIEAFKKYSRHEIVVNATSDFDVVHYLPYYTCNKNSIHPSTAWFSHQEQKEPLRTKFLTTAKQVDFCFSHSKKYADYLQRMGIMNVQQIVPGIDLEAFKPNTEIYERHTPLKVGYVGRPYQSSNRKNPMLLERIAMTKGIEFKVTGGKLKAEEMPDFYRSVDLIVSPSTNEGGPMCIIEALACGKPVLCFDNVGQANEFNYGVFRVPDLREDLFLQRLEEFRDSRLVLPPPKNQAINKMRDQVLNFTQQNFVAAHDEVWDKLGE